MGLFDFISKSQEKINVLQKRIESSSLDALFKHEKKKPKPVPTRQSKIAKQIIKMFYADYPEAPFISNDRTADWIERAEEFPEHSVIPKYMMTRFDDGLLPGHVYMLYWLAKYTNKKVPVYFEYKYGIDFGKEKEYLYEYGYLDDTNKPTDKGEEAISKHFDVIEWHAAATAKPDCSIEGISKLILAQLNNIKTNGCKEYEFIANRDCCSVCGELNKKHFPVKQFKIGVNAPPMHEGCRCSIAGYEDEEEFKRWFAALESGMTEEEYNKIISKKK